MAVNMPLQGGAADIMKQAMILVDEAIREAGLRSRMLLQVHDELLLEAPVEEVDRLVPLLRQRWAPPTSSRCRSMLTSRSATTGGT